LRCKHPHQENSRLWVTFPFAASAQNGQPEVSARVVRCKPSQSNDAVSCAATEPNATDVALCFDPASPAAGNGKGGNFAAERRATPRYSLSFPLRVRPAYLPWFEETMTTDASSDGLRFLTTREYSPSDRLFISFDPHSQSPWPSGVEIRAHIVRVESLPGKTALAVVVQRVP
jgi:hypothetical protein